MNKHTPGPWVQFADQGKCIAIMPAMREGDICTFNQSPSDADARLMTMAPVLLKALSSLVNEVDGIWSAFEHGLRQEISNTNYAVVHEKLAAAEQLLSHVGCSLAQDERS